MNNLKNLSIAIAVAGISTAASASEQPFSIAYDIDGNNRSTVYSQGEISRVTTFSQSARAFELYLYPSVNHPVNCNYAELVDLETDEIIGQASVSPLGQGTNFLFSNIYLQNENSIHHNKVIKFSCQDIDGNNNEVQHKIPGTPSIEWTSTLEGIGEWNPGGCTGHISCIPTHGRYDKLDYNSSITINNNSSESVCFSENGSDLNLGLLHGQEIQQGFYSDVFITSTEINDYNPPVIRQKLTCENPGGSTSYIRTWDVSSPDFKLIQDIRINN